MHRGLGFCYFLKMPIIRVNKKEKYTNCSNEFVHQSKTLSFPARGLLGYLLSHGDGWKFHKSKIIKDGNQDESGKNLTGRDAVDTMLEELKTTGHVRISQVRCDDGSFDGWQWEVSEEPVYRNTDFPLSVKPISENPQLQSNNNRKEKDIETPIGPQRELGLGTTDTDFETAWKHYPRKVNKKAANRAYLKAKKRGLTLEKLIECGNWWTRMSNEKKVEQFAIPHMATILNGDRWDERDKAIEERVYKKPGVSTQTIRDAEIQRRMFENYTK